jgi:protein-L-isoaspartate(D-aspartate) O-methyltransferase
MRKSWRREFLERLARAAIPVEKYWLLIRVDLIEDEDLRLFGAANCGLGFGLESGDPGQLAIIRKSGRLDTYLDRMLDIAERARAHQVPWGANVICGHPGETRASLERSAAYLRELFLRPGGTTGFLSVDPFRLYPGSPIDAERSHWEQTYGTRFHRPNWWQDGDPEFLAEWVDPSAELTYLERERLQHELLTPILAQIEANFSYTGPARAYFLRAVREQVAFCRPQSRLHYLGRYFAWQGYLGRRARSERERREYEPLRELCRVERKRRLEQIAKLAGLSPRPGAEWPADHPVLAAIEAIPRECFVPYDEITASVRDVALPLDDSGLATISAMHAYARSFGLLEIGPGDRVLDLGAGTGYGSAVLARLVGEAGMVTAIEIDAALVQRGRTTLAELGATQVRWLCADARAAHEWGIELAGISKVTVGFALDDVPSSWLESFSLGTVIVAPLRDVDDGELRLSRLVHRGEQFDIERFERVAYVPTRTPQRPTPTPTPEPTTPAVRLPIMR